MPPEGSGPFHCFTRRNERRPVLSPLRCSTFMDWSPTFYVCLAKPMYYPPATALSTGAWRWRRLAIPSTLGLRRRSARSNRSAPSACARWKRGAWRRSARIPAWSGRRCASSCSTKRTSDFAARWMSSSSRRSRRETRRRRCVSGAKCWRCCGNAGSRRTRRPASSRSTSRSGARTTSSSRGWSVAARACASFAGGLWENIFTHDMRHYERCPLEPLGGFLHPPARRDRHRQRDGRGGDRPLRVHPLRREEAMLRGELHAHLRLAQPIAIPRDAHRVGAVRSPQRRLHRRGRGA